MADEDRGAHARAPVASFGVEPLLESRLALGDRPVKRGAVAPPHALRPQAGERDDARAVRQDRREAGEQTPRPLVVDRECALGVLVHHAVQLVAVAGDGCVALRPGLGATECGGRAKQRPKHWLQATGRAVHHVVGSHARALELVEGTFQRRRLADVGKKRRHPFGTDLRRSPVVARGAARADEHVGSHAVGCLCDREPGAAGAAGDEDGPARQVHRLSLSTDTCLDV